MKLLYLSLFLLVSFVRPSKIRVAIVDTNFCPEDSPVLIHTPQERILKKGCKTHGQEILNEFLKAKLPVETHLYSVFDKNGVQKKAYWENFLKNYNKTEYDYTLIAVGTDLALNKELVEDFLKSKGIKIVAAGQAGKGISSGENLFPQKFHKKPSIILVGAYTKTLRGKRHIPKLQFFPKDIERYQVINPSLKVQGSSQAALLELIKVLSE